MKNCLYHLYLPKKHTHHTSVEEVMTKGINHFTKSNRWYGIGGALEIEITEKLRPPGAPSWANFKEVVGASLTKSSGESFCFPIFTDKILIFDRDISFSIFDQLFYESLKDFSPEEGEDFNTGKPVEYWIKLYWESMVTLERYLEEQRYPDPEVVIFEPVPEEIIQLCKE